jgi:hypothetical protein
LVSQPPTPSIFDLISSPQSASNISQSQNFTVSASSRVTPPYLPDRLDRMPSRSRSASVDSTRSGRRLSRSSLSLPLRRSPSDSSMSRPEAVPAPAEEPPKKFKRRRADAAQLQVLNSTYQRMAFPSTEERAALAVQLGMPPRSVQIWCA